MDEKSIRPDIVTMLVEKLTYRVLFYRTTLSYHGKKITLTCFKNTFEVLAPDTCALKATIDLK